MEIGRGLIITAGGMGLVFLSLAIILLVIIALNRILGPNEVPATPRPLAEALSGNPVEMEEDAVAAISAALAVMMEEEEPKKKPPARAAASGGGASLWRAAVWPQFSGMGDLRGWRW